MTDHILFSHEKRFERSAKDIHKNKHFVSSKLGESFSCDMAYNEAVKVWIILQQLSIFGVYGQLHLLGTCGRLHSTTHTKTKNHFRSE